jgi:hypothetical protein
VPAPSHSGGLHIIFSIFLGLMLSTFAGVSVYTFYGPPEGPDDQMQELSREERAIRDASPAGELPEGDRQRLQDIAVERDALRETAEQERRPWSRNTSVILIAFATLTMAVSLVRADELPVISNGLLLGGLFTMVYGIGWIVVTDTSFTRFVVLTVALAITLGLGYLRFVRRARALPVAAAADGGGVADLPEVERRLRALESRMSEAARVLGDARDDRGGR